MKLILPVEKPQSFCASAVPRFFDYSIYQNSLILNSLDFARQKCSLEKLANHSKATNGFQ